MKKSASPTWRQILFFQYGVFLYLTYTLCLNTVVAQDPCMGPPSINIQFPELDPPAAVPSGDSRYAQVILTGSEPFRVVIQDDPGSPNMFPVNEYFSHSYNTFGANPGYTMYMIKTIDRDGATSGTDDDINILRYTLICRSTATSDPLFKTLTIQILDQNDNGPMFIRAPYSVSVSELTPPGMTIYRRVVATDLDEGPNKQMTFSLSENQDSPFPCTQYFEMPSVHEGFVIVADQLDFESLTPGQTRCILTITAKDEGTPPMSSTTTLAIDIQDGDDLGPEFVYPSCIASTEPQGRTCISPRYRSTVESNSTKVSSLVFRPDPVDPSDPYGNVDIIMQDRDTLASPIVCRVASTRPEGYETYFAAISSIVSGKHYRCDVVHLANNPIDSISVPQVEIIIGAMEDTDNHRTEYASIYVDIVEIEKPPLTITASSNVAEVYELSPMGTRVLKLTFSDSYTPPDGAAPQFDIRVSAGVPFTVSRDNYVGYVEVSRLLDYEEATQYDFTVTIISQGPEKNFASISLTVKVLDVNDNSPVFSSQLSLPNNVMNEVPQGDYFTYPHYITSVWASDKDFAPVSYSLDDVDGTIQNATFRVDPSGVVSLASSVTVGDFYSVYIRASDSGVPSRSSVTIVYVRVTK